MKDSKLPIFSRLEVCPDAESLAAAAAQRILAAAQDALAQRGRFSLALAGGSTPRRCYERLRQAAFDWSRVDVYFGDERCLPVAHPDRNDVMAADAWLDRVPLPAANRHVIPAERGPEAAAQAYAGALAGALPFDLVLLGLGEDGHTASLFPGNEALGRTEAVVPVFRAPKPPAERVSLSLDTLNSARRKLFLVSGAGKRDILARLAADPALPAARIHGAEWMVDRDAWPGA